MSYDLVAVGASWGGLQAMRILLASLPPEFDVPIVFAQHRGADTHPGVLAAILRSCSHMEVCEAEDKHPIERSYVYLAPPDYHLLIEGSALALSTEGSVQFSRPSIDVMFETAADAYRERLVAVVLTGANDDGAAGVSAVKRHGGYVIAQDPATAERSQMPIAAIETGDVDQVLRIERIGPALGELVAAAAGSAR
jgi:two-component system chemotaxis response regulator CheB